MSRYASTNPAVYLRGNLSSPHAALREETARIIRAALKGRTREAAADELGISRSTLKVWLAEFPELSRDA